MMTLPRRDDLAWCGAIGRHFATLDVHGLHAPKAHMASAGVIGWRTSIPTEFTHTLRWVIMTPLGREVVPLVWLMVRPHDRRGERRAPAAPTTDDRNGRRTAHK
jgi:hypothetical protein